MSENPKLRHTIGMFMKLEALTDALLALVKAATPRSYWWNGTPAKERYCQLASLLGQQVALLSSYLKNLRVRRKTPKFSLIDAANGRVERRGSNLS